MKKNKLLGLVLALCLMAGLVIGTAATAYADDTMTITLKIKAAQTITASDVTATYGDTGKSISASVTDPATGGGAISYAVKSGDAVTVDAATGALTIVKAGTATVTVTAAETDAYAAATKDVTVTVQPKAMTVSAENVNVTVDGQPHGITVNVTDPASGATVKYGTEVGTYNLDASPTQTEAGELTVYYQVTADNYTTYTGSAKVTVNDKQTQTITASDVTATYGDTGKGISASVTEPATGGGTLSYAVKSGDAVTVDSSTGALTIAKAGTAVITVTAAETATYAQTTKDVTVTVNKANAAASTVTANNRNYDGTEKPLINIDASTLLGGEMQYALGTASEATESYTTAIPAKTEAGTYYVWYKVKGDVNHTDSAPACVTVTVHMLTVTFEVNGGSAVAAQGVASGATAVQPAAPTKSGYIFDGWYQDATLSVPYDFATPITADITLYARWADYVYQVTGVYGTTTDANHIWYKQSGTDTVTNNNTGVEITVKLTNGPDDSFDHFTGVQLDGVTLTRDVDYAARAGSTVVTLYPATLRRLANGAHTLTVLFDNNSVSTRLTVRQNSSTPATGDASNTALWAVIVTVSMLGLAALTVENKKRRTAKR